MEPLEVPLAMAVIFAEHIVDKALGKLIHNQAMKKNIENPLLLINHRRNFKDRFFLSALQSQDKILLLSIMSKHTLNDINELNAKKKLKTQQLRVLTFTPESTTNEMYRSLSSHLNEYPVSNIRQQIKNAWKGWKDLEKESKLKIKVRGYASIPTIQGILVENNYVMLEILTFHSQPDNRLGVLMTKKDCPKSFTLVSESFEALWKNSKQ